MPDIQIGQSYRFDYPVEFTTLLDYSAHRGQLVTVLRETTPDEADPPEVSGGGQMYWVVATDGWKGVADECELSLR